VAKVTRAHRSNQCATLIRNVFAGWTRKSRSRSPDSARDPSRCSRSCRPWVHTRYSDGRGRAPDRVVGPPVDHYRLRGSDGPGARGRNRPRRRRGRGALQDAGQSRCADELGHGAPRVTVERLDSSSRPKVEKEEAVCPARWRRAQVALSEYIAGIYLKSCLPRARLTGTRRTDSRADRRPTPPPPSLAGGGPHRCSIRLSYVRRCALPVDPVVVRISLLQLLAGRSKKDFVDVHVLRLAHREGHHGGERVGREGDLHRFANAGRDIRFGDTVGEVRRERAR